MKKLLIPALALVSFGLVACPGESESSEGSTPAAEESQGNSGDAPKAELVAFKVDGMT